MEIFYTKLKDTKEVDKISKKELQSKLGRKLVKQIAKNFYKVENTEIIVEKHKPKFKNSDLCFNISHSNNIIVIAFDKFPLGVDVEYMQERDFTRLSKRYNLANTTKENFYKFWTQYEAKIKIQAKIEQKICFELEQDYMLSIFSSNSNCKNTIKLYEIDEKANILNKNI